MMPNEHVTYYIRKGDGIGRPKRDRKTQRANRKHARRCAR